MHHQEKIPVRVGSLCLTTHPGEKKKFKYTINTRRNIHTDKHKQLRELESNSTFDGTLIKNTTIVHREFIVDHSIRQSIYTFQKTTSQSK